MYLVLEGGDHWRHLKIGPFLARIQCWLNSRFWAPGVNLGESLMFRPPPESLFTSLDRQRHLLCRYSSRQKWILPGGIHWGWIPFDGIHFSSGICSCHKISSHEEQQRTKFRRWRSIGALWTERNRNEFAVFLSWENVQSITYTRYLSPDCCL